MSAWQKKQLGTLCSIKTGKKDVNEGSQNGAYPFFTCSRDVHASDSYSFDTEAILIAGNGAVGETKLYRGKFEAYQRTYVLDGFEEDLDFIFYVLKGSLTEGLSKVVSGSTMPYIRKGDLERFPIPLPPLPEQKKIAHILSTVQRAIEAQERIIQTTTELKKTLMHKLFTEGLRNEPQKQTEIGLIPESWEVMPLGAIAKIGNGSTPKRNNVGYWEYGNIPWLNSTKIHELFVTEADQFVTPLAVKECHLPRVAPNSLLIAITGQGKTLGNSAIVRFETCINQHLAYAQFHSEKIIPDFVLWFMQTRYDFLRSIAQSGGSTKGALTCGYLKTHLIPIPEKNEQNEIVNIFGQLENKQKVIARKRAFLQDLFRTLLHELMTAKIRVNGSRTYPIMMLCSESSSIDHSDPGKHPSCAQVPLLVSRFDHQLFLSF